MEEQNLSQKLSQLSTSATDTKESLLMMKDIKDKIEKIPNYLTKQNESFKQIMSQALSTITTAATTTTTDNHKEELRKIAILIYKITIIQTYHRLWTTYLKSAMGQLIIQQQQKQLVPYSTNIPICPKEIKTIFKSKNIDKTNENESYLKFVNTHLHELDNQLKQFQTELNLKINHFQGGYTLTIQKMIETYIEQNLHCIRMKIEHQIELIHYDYHIQALKLEFFRHKPNEYQEQLMKEICQSKYEQEMAEQEYDFLKKQIDYYNLPSQSFQCSPIAQSPLIDSIQNPVIRQQLFKQYKEVAEQARANIFTLYMTTAEEQKDEYQKKYDTNKEKMWNAYRSPIDGNEKIDSIMLGLIHQRCQKISERIQCVYKLKIQSIVSNSKS